MMYCEGLTGRGDTSDFTQQIDKELTCVAFDKSNTMKAMVKMFISSS